MKATVERNMSAARREQDGTSRISTARISFTSAAVCIGILAWALISAWLAQR